jgi:hypothetical protein
MKNKKQAITSTHVTIPDDYYSMSREDRRAFLSSVLRGMSPNPEVRATAGKKFRKPKN